MSARVILFLDVDGVLNHHQSFKDAPYLGQSSSKIIDRDCLARLRYLVEATGADIVLSSTWRLYDQNCATLTSHGIQWIGKTPDLAYSRDSHGVFVTRPRRDEIMQWLDEHDPNREALVLVLDDDGGAGLRSNGRKSAFIKTKFTEGGLTDTHVAAAIRWVERQRTAALPRLGS